MLKNEKISKLKALLVNEQTSEFRVYETLNIDATKPNKVLETVVFTHRQDGVGTTTVKFNKDLTEILEILTPANLHLKQRVCEILELCYAKEVVENKYRVAQANVPGGICLGNVISLKFTEATTIECDVLDEVKIKLPQGSEMTLRDLSLQLSKEVNMNFVRSNGYTVGISKQIRVKDGVEKEIYKVSIGDYVIGTPQYLSNLYLRLEDNKFLLKFNTNVDNVYNILGSANEGKITFNILGQELECDLRLMESVSTVDYYTISHKLN